MQVPIGWANREILRWTFYLLLATTSFGLVLGGGLAIFHLFGLSLSWILVFLLGGVFGYAVCAVCPPPIMGLLIQIVELLEEILSLPLAIVAPGGTELKTIQLTTERDHIPVAILNAIPCPPSELFDGYVVSVLHPPVAVDSVDSVDSDSVDSVVGDGGGIDIDSIDGVGSSVGSSVGSVDGGSPSPSSPASLPESLPSPSYLHAWEDTRRELVFTKDFRQAHFFSSARQALLFAQLCYYQSNGRYEVTVCGVVCSSSVSSLTDTE